MDDSRVEFLFTLYFVGRKVKGHYKVANKDHMLSAAILHLLEKKESTLSELARILYSKLSSLSEKITKMEQDGLVKKVSKRGDERELYISLTPLGQKKVRKMIDDMKLHCNEFMPDITSEDLKQVNPVLKKMAA